MPQNASGPVPWLPWVAAFRGGAFFLFAGVWAMTAPSSFFEQSARFSPITANRHFIQDIGAFQIGLGAVLLLAATWRGRDPSRSRGQPGNRHPVLCDTRSGVARRRHRSTASAKLTTARAVYDVDG
jgi:hypothetical protein